MFNIFLEYVADIAHSVVRDSKRTTPFFQPRTRSLALPTVIVVIFLLVFVLLHQSLGGNVKDIHAFSNGADPVPWWTSEDFEVPKFAYAQYATDLAYFCNAIINVGRLIRYGVKHDIILMYPDLWDKFPDTGSETRALSYAKSSFPYLILLPMPLISTTAGDPTWSHSLTKFNIFRLTNYSRVLYFDSDSLILNSMDHYFLAPLASIAVPRAYRLNDQDLESHKGIARQTLGSHVMLVQPNIELYHAIERDAARSGDFDMEIVNRLFGDSALILPHRRLALLTGEFRSRDHSRYLRGEINADAEWNAMAEVSRSALVHFSDWPLSKPWLPRDERVWETTMPRCEPDIFEVDKETADRPPCADRMMWLSFYSDYDSEKSNVCDGHF